MGIGGSIFLIAVGAILVFGVTGDTVWWLNLDAVGWILIAAGLFCLVLSLRFLRNRQRKVQPPPGDDDRGMFPEDRKYTEEYRTEVHPPERRY